MVEKFSNNIRKKKGPCLFPHIQANETLIQTKLLTYLDLIAVKLMVLQVLWRFFNFYGLFSNIPPLVPKIKTNSYESVSSMSPLLTKRIIIMSRSDVGLFQLLRASPAVLRMWSCKVKWDEEKSKYAGLAQENGFASAYLHSLQWLVNLHKRV